MPRFDETLPTPSVEELNGDRKAEVLVEFCFEVKRRYEEMAWFLNNGFMDYLRLIEMTSAPPNPADGLIAYADGTSWNPGATGEGVYAYVNGAWTKL